MATPSLKTRTELCLSLRSSERTTPPNRGPTSGEPPGRSEPQQPFPMATFEAQRGRRRGASECLQHRGDFFGTLKWNGQKERETSSCVWKREEKKKNKEQNKTVFTFSCSCVSSRHDEHCAFLAVCGLKFFTVLAQFVGVNVSSLLKLL